MFIGGKQLRKSNQRTKYNILFLTLDNGLVQEIIPLNSAFPIPFLI